MVLSLFTYAQEKVVELSFLLNNSESYHNKVITIEGYLSEPNDDVIYVFKSRNDSKSFSFEKGVFIDLVGNKSKAKYIKKCKDKYVSFTGRYYHVNNTSGGVIGHVINVKYYDQANKEFIDCLK